MNVMVAVVWVRGPLVPVTVRVYVPAETAETPKFAVAEVADGLTLSDEGLSVALRPGEGFAVSATAPLNPFREDTVGTDVPQVDPVMKGQENVNGLLGVTEKSPG